MAITLGHREIVITPGTGEDFDITTIQSSRIPLGSVAGVFQFGETVTQAVTGASGMVYSYHRNTATIRLVEMVGTFDAVNVITGSGSFATGIPKFVYAAFPNGIRLSAVDFIGSSPNDRLIIRNSSAIGWVLFDRKDASGGGVHQAVGGRSIRQKPYIAISQCTLSNPYLCRIRLEYD